MSDPFKNDFSDMESGGAFNNSNIPDENDIFEKEKEVTYQPPMQEVSVFDHPTYRSTSYEAKEQNLVQEQPVSNQKPEMQVLHNSYQAGGTQTMNETASQGPSRPVYPSQGGYELQKAVPGYDTNMQQTAPDNGKNVQQQTTPDNGKNVQQQTTLGSEKNMQQQTTFGSEKNMQQQTTPDNGKNVQQQTVPGYGKNMHQQKPLPPKKKKEKKKGGFGKKLLTCIVLAIVFGVVSGGVFLGVTKLGGTALGIEEQQSNQSPAIGVVGDTKQDSEELKEEVTVAEVSGDVYTVAQVAERCMPAMVGITNKSIQEVPNYFGFGSQNYESESSGSGIIIGQTETELLIATNNHVISGANTLTVCFVDDELVNAIVKGTDAENDLAVISVSMNDIKPETLNAIKVIELGDSDSLKVGEQVVAIGNALGYGQSVSSGYISALNREVTIDNTALTLMQTDAAINPGNSGGALLNMKGQLIGINESKYADTAVEGMGYAIPISTATPILSNLMSRETRYKVEKENASYIGISCKDISAEFAEMYNVPTGVYIDSVVEGGPAAAAGLQKGDIITKFDGVKTGSYSDLISQLEYYSAGEIVEIVFYRTNDGVYTEQTTSIVLGARSESELAEQQTETENTQNSQNPKDEDYGFFGGDGGFDIFDFFGY